MKIILFGYGKMGKAIEEQAELRGHEIVLRINSANRDSFFPETLHGADAIIEFTAPHVALENFKLCIASGLPTITGTTGWTEGLEQVKQLVAAQETGFLYGSNFSLGVNILFWMNKKLAALMEQFPEYKVMLEEIHHTAKLDAPSGTAISLAQQIIHRNTRYDHWENEISEETGVLPVVSKRVENVPGTHTVAYQSVIDDIEIRHVAHNRKGFALGAVMAAEWLQHKKGLFEVTEMFNFDGYGS